MRLPGFASSGEGGSAAVRADFVLRSFARAGFSLNLRGGTRAATERARAARPWKMIDEILEYNRRFVDEKRYERFITDKYPNRRIAIVTCMDTRLVELLPAALGLRNGDVKVIKNAGGTITNPFDSTVRSLLVAIYELGVREVMVVGHTGCGVQGMDSAHMQRLMRERGIPEQHITLMKHCGIDLDEWLHGFDDTPSAILETVDLVRNHPLVPGDVTVRGYIMDSVTGALEPIG